MGHPQACQRNLYSACTTVSVSVNANHYLFLLQRLCGSGYGGTHNLVVSSQASSCDLTLQVSMKALGVAWLLQRWPAMLRC